VSPDNPYLFDLDPSKIFFTERGQNTGPYRGDPTDAILTYEDNKGRIHVLDGHHRVLRARRLKVPVRAIVMPESVYLQMKREGIHQADMQLEFVHWLQRQPRWRRK